MSGQDGWLQNARPIPRPPLVFASSDINAQKLLAGEDGRLNDT